MKTLNELSLKASKIECLVCDVDGVLTDGLIHLDNHGNTIKSFSIQDGMGLKLLMAAGIQVAIITTSAHGAIDARIKQLGIEHYFPGQVDKRPAFDALQRTLNLPDEAFAYIGDDLPDLPLIRKAGLGIAVANAIHQVKAAADWQTEQSGGRGAVRAVCELLLSTQNKEEAALSRYFAEAQ